MRTADRLAQPHVVYRAYGTRGHLLYVGCTSNLTQRMTAHRNARTPWLPLVARVTVERFPDGPAGFAAESAAIQQEAPVWNVQGSGVTKADLDRIEWAERGSPETAPTFSAWLRAEREKSAAPHDSELIAGLDRAFARITA